MSLTVSDLKDSLRIDGSQDDAQLDRYLKAATAYIKNAVGNETDVPKFYDDEQVINNFETAVLALAGTYWTYRVSVSSITVVPIDLVLSSIIAQLRGQYEEQLEEVMTNGKSG